WRWWARRPGWRGNRSERGWPALLGNVTPIFPVGHEQITVRGDEVGDSPEDFGRLVGVRIVAGAFDDLEARPRGPRPPAGAGARAETESRRAPPAPGWAP